MQNPPPQSPPPPPPPPLPPALDMESTSIWDWSQFLDFEIDDQLPASPTQSDHSLVIPTFEELPPLDHPPVISVSNSFPVDSNSKNNDRVRKRDPRVTCPNFSAGRIPCACPELDAQLAAEEEEAGPGKKRAKTAKTARASTAARARCQVPGCEADISELKGYHKRHRVCLRCANANSVVLDGHNKRYCQQCGKFHLLADFDEGKRSCRRKLERHNNRRRRKPSNSKSSGERELQSAEDDRCDEEAGKDSSEAAEGETLSSAGAGEGHNAQNIQKESVASFAASREAQTDEVREKITLSPSYCDDKIAFSSACPTGRISFKLYDWNPAEFPRRLRHQIFQWLGSMPVELEGYIRPGCTILTLFISMPSFMWVQLFEDPVVRICNLLASPRNMLSGRGTFFVHLNSMVFRVMEDGKSVIKVKIEEQAPKLHYVHPTCFEAGKPMELLVCGSNLLQARLRFLVSFAGKYLINDVSVSSLGSKTDSATNFDHQLLNICVPHTELDSFGPGFIEVENEYGLSNFIPVLIADEEICSEINKMQMRFYLTSESRDSLSTATSISCEVAVSRQNKFSELLSDMAWLLREPAVEDMGHAMTASQLQRFTWVLNFLIEHDSTTVLKRVLHCMKMRIDQGPATGIIEADRTLFQETMNHAMEVLDQRLEKRVKIVLQGNDQSAKDRLLPVIPTINQDTWPTESRLGALVGASSAHKNEAVPLLNADCIMSVRVCKEEPEKSSDRIMFTNSNRYLTYRPLVFVIASAAVCFGICVVVFLPQKATGIATTIRRCLFDHSNS